METNTLFNVIVGAVASTIGIFISKVLDLFQNRQQHSLNRKTEFFKRKLDVFEKNVSFWTTTSGHLSIIMFQFDQLIDDKIHFDEATSKGVFDMISNQTEVINNNLLNDVSSLELYIDIPMEKLQYYLNQFNYLMGEVGLLSLQLEKSDVDITIPLKKKIIEMRKVFSDINDEIAIIKLVLRKSMQKLDEN